MSWPLHPSRTAHSTGSVPSVVKAPPASPASSYSDADLAQDEIAPLSTLPNDQIRVYRRARRTSSGRSRHRRASSLRSATSTSDLPLSTFEKPEEDITMATLSRPRLEVVTPRTASMSKMLPRQHKAGRGYGSIDLSKSRVEHESMGVSTPLENNDLCSPIHHRAGSSISQSSVSSDLGWRLGSPATFVHPMRQTPQSFTSPITRSQNNNYIGSYYSTISTEDINNEEDEELPLEPPQMHFRHTSFSSTLNRCPSNTVLSATLNSTSQVNLRLVSPSESPQSQEFFSPVGTPATARSSLDSTMFGNKKTHCPTNPEEFAAEVQRLRREYLERQRAKDEKIAAKETRAREKQLRKEEKRERRSVSRRDSKPLETSASEDEADSSGPEAYSFPPFCERADGLFQPCYEDSVVGAETTSASISTPPEYKGPPVKIARRKVSNTWGKIKFDATTFRIHMLRSMGLRSRE